MSWPMPLLGFPLTSFDLVAISNRLQKRHTVDAGASSFGTSAVRRAFASRHLLRLFSCYSLTRFLHSGDIKRGQKRSAIWKISSLSRKMRRSNSAGNFLFFMI